MPLSTSPVSAKLLQAHSGEVEVGLSDVGYALVKAWGFLLEVDVFYAADLGQIAVAPAGSQVALPQHNENGAWMHLLRTSLEDKFLSTARPIIEAQIGVQGVRFLKLTK